MRLIYLLPLPIVLFLSSADWWTIVIAVRERRGDGFMQGDADKDDTTMDDDKPQMGMTNTSNASKQQSTN